MQRTLVILKPDAVQKFLIGPILSRFEAKGLKIVGLKMMNMDKALCDEHYSHMTDKPFYPAIVSFMTNGPIVVVALEGRNVIAIVRQMCGATNPDDATMGTIRGDFAKSIDNNIIHSSDSEETANVELSRFFKNDQLYAYERTLID